MKASPFAYLRARSLAEVFDALARHGESAKILAGGQSLMPALNMRLASPALLIDITRLSELAGIDVDGRAVRIRALTTHAAIARSTAIRQHLPLLADAVHHIAHPAIRNSGTFGGSLAMADPAAEWPACCITLDAQIVLASKQGERTVAARDFFHGPYATALRPDEVLTEVIIPIPGAGYRHAFLELTRRHGDYAIVGIAALAKVTNATLSDVRLTYLGVSSTPVLAAKVSQVFDFKQFSEAQLEAAHTLLDSELDATGDLYHSADTKRHLARVLTARALRQLLA